MGVRRYGKWVPSYRHSRFWNLIYNISVLITFLSLLLGLISIVKPHSIESILTKKLKIYPNKIYNNMSKKIKLGIAHAMEIEGFTHYKKKSKSIVRVKTKYANVRIGPGIEYHVKKVLRKNQVIRVFETRGCWIRIGKDSWISHNLIAE